MSETGLFIELASAPEAIELTVSLPEGSGLVIDPATISQEDAQRLQTGTAVVRSSEPQRFQAWQEQEDLWWAAAEELDEIARLRDRWPGLQWLPRIEIYKQEVVYRFNDSALGEGFRFYIPDTGAINGYLTVAGEQPMEAVLRRAAELGFASLWLHGAHAEMAGMGLDLELLERAGRIFTGSIWFSGGAGDERHLFNLARQGGASGVIVTYAMAAKCGCDRLQLALGSGADDAVPLKLQPASVKMADSERNASGCNT